MFRLCAYAPLVAVTVVAAQTADELLAPDEAPLAEAIAAFETSLDFRVGEIALGDGLAALSLPEGFVYLGSGDTRRVLEEAWGNPDGSGSLGMILPADRSPLEADAWGLVIGYLADGHVSGDDAAALDAPALLARMRAATAAENRLLQELGLATVEIVGWVDPPRYEPAGRILTWATELAFADGDDTTLNYSVRLLGRRGVLTLNAVAAMAELTAIRAALPALAGAIRFNPGHGFADFRPGEDGLAGYGLAALVAGVLPDDASGPATGTAPAETTDTRAVLLAVGLVVVVLAAVWFTRRRPRD